VNSSLTVVVPLAKFTVGTTEPPYVVFVCTQSVRWAA